MPLSKKNLKPSKNPVGPSTLRPVPVTHLKPKTTTLPKTGGAKRP